MIGLLGRQWAAVLACGEGAALSHWSAAVAWRMRAGDGGADARQRRPLGTRRAPGSTCTGARSTPDEITTLDGLPITTPARTTIDLAAAGLRGRKLEAALDAAVEHELDFSDLHRLLDRHRGRPGVPAVSALLERYTPGTVDTRSVLEEIVLDLCDAHGIPRPLTTSSSPAAGATSSGPTSRSSSRPTPTAGTAPPAASPPTARRDVELTLAGIPFLRFSYEQITEEPGTWRRRRSPRSLARGRAAPRPARSAAARRR